MSMNRVNQERLLYENQLRIYRGQLAALKDPNAPEQAAEREQRQIDREGSRNRAIRRFARHRAGAL